MQVCVNLRAEGKLPDVLLVVEHDPVFTVGRKRGAADDVLTPGDIPVVTVGRGGGVTYHGPGQLVVYPIVELRSPVAYPVDFLRTLEQILIETLAGYGVKAQAREGYTGVWVESEAGLRKVASIGVSVRRGVTEHGLALNINMDMEPFRRINPCGLSAEVMTNVTVVTEEKVEKPSLIELIRTGFETRLNCTFEVTPSPQFVAEAEHGWSFDRLSPPLQHDFCDVLTSLAPVATSSPTAP